jgi:acyl carrier protein phosphodiesterase
MNFFAHAVVAARRCEDPSWLLGSMLPDFVSMAGLRLTAVLDAPALERGVAFHHASDDAFHGAPLFVELMEDAREALEREGLDSGPAMAIAHVGVELLLDGVLVTRQGVAPSFRAAIHAASDAAPRLRFAGLAPELGEARWRQLCARLDGAPLPERYAEPAFVADRLIFILARRPRLAVPAADHHLVFAWAERALPQVSARADALFEQVEARLRSDPRPTSVGV